MSLPEIFISPSEDLDIVRRKLSFRSWTRGTQESDLILGSFADEYLGSLDDIQLERFQALLDCSDLELFDWIFGISAPPPEHDHDVMRLLRTHCAERHARPQSTAQSRT